MPITQYGYELKVLNVLMWLVDEVAPSKIHYLLTGALRFLPSVRMNHTTAILDHPY